MSTQNFSLSFTSEDVAIWDDFDEISPSTTTFSDVVTYDETSPSTTIFADIPTLDKISPSVHLDTEGICYQPNSMTGPLRSTASNILRNNVIVCNNTELAIPSRNLGFWFDASDESTIITTAAPDVDEWRDKSDNRIILSQTIPDKKPHTGGATINGLNVITFDGSDDYLLSTYDISDFPFKNDTVADFFVVLNLNATSHSHGVCNFGSKFGNINYALIYINTSNDPYPLVRDSNLNTSNRADSNYNLNSTNTFLIRITVVENNYLWQKNTVDRSPTVGIEYGSWVADCNNIGHLSIGARVLNNETSLLYFLHADLCEVVYYSDYVLSESESKKLNDYLIAKWGI